MANYYGMFRTNYFQVTDEERYKDIICKLSCDGDFDAWDDIDENGIKRHAFGGDGSLCAYDEETGDDVLFALLDELSGILPENDAVIITEVGHEKLRYLVGVATVIARKGTFCVDLENAALDSARCLLGDDRYVTRFDY